MDWNRRADALTLIGRLRIATTDKERVAVCKSLRVGRFWPSEASFYLIAFTIQRIADQRIERQQKTTFKSLNEKIRAIKKARRVAYDHFWPRRKGPKKYQALEAQWEKVADRITADTFCEYSEPEMADLFLNNRSEFRRLYEAGRVFFQE